jgi:transcriptional regulator with XRE-family HTH domain
MTLLDMRRTLGLSQRELAKQMGKAVITVAKWETSRSPSGQSLVDLRNFAHAKNLPDHEAAFEFELRRSVIATEGPVVRMESLPGAPLAQTIPFETAAEMEAMLAARHMVRTKQTFQKALRDIRLVMKLFSARNPGEAVLLLDRTLPRNDPGALLQVLKAYRKKIEETRHG